MASKTATATRERLQATINKAGELCKKLQEKTISSAKAADAVVRQRPYAALGIVFAIGIAVGAVAIWMMTRDTEQDEA